MGNYLVDAPHIWRGHAVTAGVAAAAFLLLSLFPHPLIHPSVWEDVSVSAGLRPPMSPFPGIYRAVVSLLFACLSADAAISLLPLLGRGCIALAAGGVYLVFREVLPATLRLKTHMGHIGARVGTVVASSASLLFVCADPVWRAGQAFSPVTVFLVLVVASAALFFRFLRRGSIPSLYGCFALLGALSAETAIGFVLALVAAGGVLAAIRWARDPDVPLVNPLVDRLVREVVSKRLTYVWAAFFALTVALGVCQFVTAGGMEATGLEGVLGLVFVYLKGVFDGVCAAATGQGWFFGFFLSVFPLLFAVAMLPRAWNDDRFLPYTVGVLYLAIGVASLSQLSGLRTLWYWRWSGERPMVPSDTLLAFFLLFDVAAAAFALAVFGVDACCRNYRRIAQRRFPESMQFETPARLADSLGRARVFRLRFFWTMVAFVPLCTLPGRRQPLECGIGEVIAAYGAEVLREADGCDTIFTDGSLDLLLELEAHRRGRTLNCLSMMAPNTARERIVRLRAAENAEDSALLDNDAVSALRTWLAARPDRLGRAAVQLGFELWKREGLPLPPLSGVIARPDGIDEVERTRALEECRAIGDRAYALASGLKHADPALVRLFSFVVWRLARLAQLRSQVADLGGRRAEAFREATLADELDAVNPAVAGLRRNMIWCTKQGSGVLTPREGLVIGLARADFALAGRYAAPVLAADPDDPRANFAMGMMYYTDEQYARAESHLLRCLVRRPDDAAVLNNLAIVQMKIGKLDEAEAHAIKATARLPDSPETRRTLEKIRERKSDSKRRTRHGNET